ncbi:MAG: hypothetical protein LBV72_08095 [Tannerella sp.]|jgi:hypothetical protein|nr:hypothetical protein [Tannerella sp.]
MKNVIAICWILGVMLLVSCQEDSLHLQESEFVTSCRASFVFIDENGNDLINIDDGVSTYPFSFEKLPELYNEEVNPYGNGFLYNGNFNTIEFHTDLERYCWKTCLYGFDNVPSYKTYVQVGSFGIDSILTKYSFTGDCIGRPICAQVEELYYNETLIYSSGKLSKIFEPEVVFIKKEKGKTSVITE